MLHPQLRIEHVAPGYEALLPEGGVITIQSLPYGIGRGFGSQLRVDHPDISRRHACVRMADDYYLLEDLSSRNGTLLNGVRLAPGETRRLADGDTIQLAGALSLVFVDPFATRNQPHVQPLAARGLWLDPQAQIVLLGSRRITLPLQQFRLLALLYARPGAVVSRAEIAEALWATGEELTEQMIDNTVSRLRANLQPHAGGHEYVVTVRGLGYRFVQAG
jgi:DNA-binding response OmpR family regulator